MANSKRPTQEQLQEWREKYGKIYTLESEDEVNGDTIFIVARKPSRASFERYQEEVTKKGAKAMRQFVRENILYPGSEDLMPIFDDKPGILNGIASKLQDEMGVSVSFTMTES